jgi:hypothetical protein
MGTLLIISFVACFVIGGIMLRNSRIDTPVSLAGFIFCVFGTILLFTAVFIPVRTTITKQTKFFKALSPAHMIIEHNGALYTFSKAVDYQKYATLKEVYLREYYNSFGWQIGDTITLDNKE